MILSLLVIAPPADSATVVPEREPNNTTAQAQPVASGATIQGSFARTSNCSSYDCDVYKVTSTSSGRLVLDLRFASNLGTEDEFDLRVTETAGNQLLEHDVSSADFDGSRLRNTVLYVPAGITYISLTASTGGSRVWTGKPYTLTPTLVPAASETEINDDTAHADVLTMGRSIVGSAVTLDCGGGDDCDVYRLPLTKATRLQVDLRFPCTLGTDDLYWVVLTDTRGNALAELNLSGSDCNGSKLRSTRVTAPAGNFYVLLESDAWGVARGKKYTLTVSGAITPATPKISGTAKVGSTLSARPGTWGPSPLTLKYQWLSNGKAISGATKSTYKVSSANAGKTISVKVTGSRSGYASASRTSSQMVVPLQSLTRTPRPTISGSARVGSTLTARPGTWSPAPVTLKYQWLSNGKAISGATKSTYKLSSANAGKTISVKVTGSKSAYKSVAKTSLATGTIKR